MGQRGAAAAAAFAGGLISGYLSGKKMKSEDEERQARNEEREARKAEREQKKRDDDELRAVLSSNPGDRNASILSVGGPDMGDIIQGVPPPSHVETIKKVGTNVYSDSAAADRAAEMENFATGADEGQATAIAPRDAFKVKGVGVFDDPAQAADAAQQAGEDASMAASTRASSIVKKGIPGARDPLDHYLKDVAPKAIQTLVKQGRIEEAKRYSDFLESRDGVEYAKLYTHGVRQLAVGDYQGALGKFEKIYNDDMYPDGRRVKFTPLEGDQMQIDQLDADGNVVASKAGKVSDLTEQAALMLSPLQAVKFMAEQTAKRKSEAASLDKSLQLEGLRQQGQEVREDRRDERLGMRLDQQSQQFERRLQVERERRDNPKPLTATQQRTNDAIDAARQQITGMSQADILRKTQSSMASGRANPDYDPNIARAAKLANSRKFGDDAEHDKFSAGKAEENAAANARAEIASRFRSDKTMANRTLGKETPDGIEVLEKGRLVGYYR